MRGVNPPERLPKALGADIELGNFLLGEGCEYGSGSRASRLLLRCIPGISGRAFFTLKQDPCDIGRKWLRNGACCYIDLEHLEICLPEVRNAWDFTAAFHALLRIVQTARCRAEAILSPEVSLQVLACNSDGCGSSWGSHLNFLVTRRCFDNIFHRRLDYLLWLASYQASSVLITGQGKVGAENGAEPAAFQLSQRADFFEEVVGHQTTYRRPIINSRNEPLCGDSARHARFHHIACDVNLCHIANILKVGILQILLAMVECETPLIDPGLILHEPVRAFQAYSHDPGLTAQQSTLGAQDCSALDLQRRFFDAASEFAAQGECEETVPRAGEILALWGDTLDRLAARDWDTLSRRLDWALKRSLLEGTLAQNPGMDWDSPAVKQLDLLYGSLDPQEGLYWAMERAGCAERRVSDQEIQRFVRDPPADTRAAARAGILRAVEPGAIIEVDWDRVRVRSLEPGSFGCSTTIRLDDPLDAAPGA